MIDWQRADRPRRRIGRGVEAHLTIGSTNDRARALLDARGGEGRAVVAEEQTDGRGRRGRTWYSPPRRNLMLSVAVRPRIPAADAWRLGMSVALAARTACSATAPVELKWPNDIIARDGRKLAGVLIETAIDGGRLTDAVIGIGINVNWPRSEMPAEIARDATSLAELAGSEVDRVELLGSVLDALDVELVALEAGASPLERYRAACLTLGTEVGVDTADGRIEGTAIGIDEAGALVIETATGPVALTSGEIVRLRAGAPA
ncbi:MAG: biotin--[acetyl-CoA-carboxylase] ligase [Candidatus Limnocylindria bacterium]